MIRAELVSTNVLTRWPCHVCGRHTEKSSVLCEVPRSHPTHAGFRICENCLESRDWKSKLQSRAAEIEAHAAELRQLIDQIDAPSFEDWQHAEALCCALMMGDAGEEASFDEAMRWPRERQDAAIAAMRARHARMRASGDAPAWF
jgi:hypothetical protein